MPGYSQYYRANWVLSEETNFNNIIMADGTNVSQDTQKTFVNEEFEHEVFLPRSGKVATFKEGTAKDMINVGKMVGEDKDKGNFALLEELCLLDGEKAYADQFAELKLKDFTILMKAFSDVNF